MQRTAYINKENRVVYIAAFAEDAITPNAKGKLLFTAGDYNAETQSYAHIFGKGEEIFAVEDSGLSVGDIYTPPAAPAEPDTVAALEGEVQSLEDQLKLDYLKENIDPATFNAWVEEKAHA